MAYFSKGETVEYITSDGVLEQATIVEAGIDDDNEDFYTILWRDRERGTIRNRIRKRSPPTNRFYKDDDAIGEINALYDDLVSMAAVAEEKSAEEKAKSYATSADLILKMFETDMHDKWQKEKDQSKEMYDKWKKRFFDQ